MDVDGRVFSAHVLPILRKDVFISINQWLNALEPPILKSVSQSLGLEIVEEDVNLFCLEFNANFGGKVQRRSNQSNYWEHLLVEADGVVTP